MNNHLKNFNNLMNHNEEYQKALGIVKDNSKGKIWLIGGAVYRTLLFGDCNQSKDFDFIVEHVNKNLKIPEGYFERRTKFGGLCLKSHCFNEIEIMQLDEIYHIMKNNLGPTIDNYLLFTPFNIHSIAYDVDSRKIIGNIGLGSVREGILRTNDSEMAENMAEKYSSSINSLLRKKAKELDFDYERYLGE